MNRTALENKLEQLQAGSKKLSTLAQEQMKMLIQYNVESSQELRSLERELGELEKEARIYAQINRPKL